MIVEKEHSNISIGEIKISISCWFLVIFEIWMLQFGIYLRFGVRDLLFSVCPE